jgi:DNA invertase Pin-like site-specific DNA recombinase
VDGLAFAGRPAFTKLQTDINVGIIKTVIAKSYSRIGINTGEVMGWIADIRSKGVEFITADGL